MLTSPIATHMAFFSNARFDSETLVIEDVSPHHWILHFEPWFFVLSFFDHESFCASIVNNCLSWTLLSCPRILCSIIRRFSHLFCFRQSSHPIAASCHVTSSRKTHRARRWYTALVHWIAPTERRLLFWTGGNVRRTKHFWSMYGCLANHWLVAWFVLRIRTGTVRPIASVSSVYLSLFF